MWTAGGCGRRRVAVMPRAGGASSSRHLLSAIPQRLRLLDGPPSRTMTISALGLPHDMVAGDKADSRLHTSSPEQELMRTASAFRAGLIALLALAGVTFTTAADADGGSISFNVIKAGIVIGGSAGSGTLVFPGQGDSIGGGGVW